MNPSQPTARLRPFRPVPFGRYTLLAQLATGGMGEIYLARIEGAQGFEKLCVIKKILPTLAQDMDFVERFVNEAKTLVKLSHGSIAQVLDMGLHEGDPYIALEHVDGKDLRKVAARMRERNLPPPLTFVLYVMSRVLDALAYAHRKRDDDERELNLVHRDISPQNILVSYEGEVKVIDFGLAKSTLSPAKTNPGLILGKFLYMSPEHARHQKVDRRSDLYSVGLCLYELISGKNPFDDVAPGELMAKVANPEIPSLQSVDPLCPGSVSQVVMRALAMDPAQRFQTAEEFRARLLNALLEIDPTAGPETVSKFMRDTFASEYQAERRLLGQLKDSLKVMMPMEPATSPNRQETGVHQIRPQSDAKPVLPRPPDRRSASGEVAPASLIGGLAAPPGGARDGARPLSDVEPTRPVLGTSPRPRSASTEPGELVTEHDIPVITDPASAEGAKTIPMMPAIKPVPRAAAVTETMTTETMSTDPRVIVGKLLEEGGPSTPMTDPGERPVSSPAPSRAPPAKARTGPNARAKVAPQALPLSERPTIDPTERMPALHAPVPAAARSFQVEVTARTHLPNRVPWLFVIPVVLVTVAGVAYVLWDIHREGVLAAHAAEEVVVEDVAKPPPAPPKPAAEPPPAPPKPEAAAPAPSFEESDEDLVVPLTRPTRKPGGKKKTPPAQTPSRRETSGLLKEWTKVRLSFEELERRQPCDLRSMTLLCERYENLKAEVIAAGDDPASQQRLLPRIQSLAQVIEQRKANY